jgi:hypothetical protein
MADTMYSSRAAQEAIWALLPDKRPGITVKQMQALLPQYTVPYVRSVLCDMNRSGTLDREYFRRGRSEMWVQYARGSVQSLPPVRVKLEREVKPCSRCREPFRRAHRFNFLCLRCSEYAGTVGSAFA